MIHIAMQVFVNAGPPMIFPSMLRMLVALVPVIALESFFIKSVLNLSLRQATKVMGFANLISTILGIPLTWILLVIFMFIARGQSGNPVDTPSQKIVATVFESPWLHPSYEPHFYWMVPAATLVLLIPFFFASWVLEYHVATAMLCDSNVAQIRYAIMRANLISYGILACVTLVSLATARPNQTILR